MHITIGLLAHNESSRILHTLDSLFSQTIFKSSFSSSNNAEFDIVVIPNGCTDDTAALATTAITRVKAEFANLNLNFLVDVLELGDKSNAWNHLVHKSAKSSTDYFIFLDSDIIFCEEKTIECCMQMLIQNSELIAVVDLPKKYFPEDRKLTLLERYSANMSKSIAGRIPGICGQFYCARGGPIRDIYLPLGLSGEDGFINAMLTTNCFRRTIDRTVIARAPGASHYYEGISNLKSIIKHEVRLVVGGTQNQILTEIVFPNITNPMGMGAGVLIEELNKNNPNWCNVLIDRVVASRGFRLFPKYMLMRRITALKPKPFKEKCRRFLPQLLATIFDWVCFVKANRLLKNGKTLGHW